MEACVTASEMNLLSKQAAEPISYMIEKMTFPVTPVYNESSGKTVHEILYDLMKNESITLENTME